MVFLSWDLRKTVVDILRTECGDEGAAVEKLEGY